MDDDLAATTLDRLFAVTVLLGTNMNQHLGEQGLTESRAHILFVLHGTGPTTQRTLADALDVAPRTITGLVDGLVASGHVTREPHPSDGRATLVTPTEQGADAGAAFAAGRIELAEQLFGDWWPDHLASFATGLENLFDTLETLVEEAT